MRTAYSTASRAVVLGCLLIISNETCRAACPYQLDPKREWALVGAGAVLGIASIVIVRNVQPLTVEEIAELDPEEINNFDRRAIRPYRETGVGDGLLYASYLFPLTFLTYPDTKRDWRTLGVMWIEATLLQLGITGVVKGVAQRTRPYVYDPDTSEEKKTSTEARLSFYSGHAVATATNCFFVAKVFSDYLTDRKAKTLIWSGAVLYPVLTAYLRRDSGHHFRTDVLTGYCVGALIGYLVPYFHRLREGHRISVSPASIDGELGVGLRLSF